MSIKEGFERKVMDLFASICTSTEHDITAQELIQHLTCEMEHGPNCVQENKDEVRLIYDHITVTVSPKQMLLKVEYLQSLAVEVGDIGKCDVKQLGKFILQLDEAVPTWKELWDRRNRVLCQQFPIHEKLKAMLKNMKETCCKYLSHRKPPINTFRLAYYNIRAEQYMLDHEVTDWMKQKSEQEIMDRCIEQRLVPPIEEWCKDFELIVAEVECERQKLIEKRRKEQEQRKRKIDQNKQKLANMQTLLASLKLYVGFTLRVENRSWKSHHFFRDDEMSITLQINAKEHSILIRYIDVESKTPYLMQSIRRINELMPKLDDDKTMEELEMILKEMDKNLEFFGNIHKPLFKLPNN